MQDSSKFPRDGSSISFSLSWLADDLDQQYFAFCLGRHQRSEKALVLTLQESYLQGVSTRKVKKITEKLCGVEFAHACVPCGKDQVSRMAQELDETLET